VEKELYPWLESNAPELDCHILACNGMKDHVHVVMSLHPQSIISVIVGSLKGGSAHFINDKMHVGGKIRWQTGYWVVSISETDLQRVIRYVHNQKDHHKKRSIEDIWEWPDNLRGP